MAGERKEFPTSRTSSTKSSTKSPEDFVVHSELKQEQQLDLFTNPTRRVFKKMPDTERDINKQKYKNIWYMKKQGDANRAMCEVIAQEFFRLLVQWQPKTRLAESKESGTYILSKQVEAFESLADISMPGRIDFKQRVIENTLFGLGDVIVTALLMNEIDLKASNMGRDRDSLIVKIDGDCCFARFTLGLRTQPYHITSDGITQLPRVDKKEYYYGTWLTAYDDELTDPAFYNALDKIKNHPIFRLEVHQAIFRVMMLPDELIKAFILHYIPEGELSNLLYEEILLRRDRLMYAAILNDGFNHYFNDPRIAVSRGSDAQRYLHYLSQFETTGKRRIVGKKDVPEEKMVSITKIPEQLQKFKDLSKKIRADKTDFLAMDAIAYPILYLLDVPNSPQRKKVLDGFKKIARAAYQCEKFSDGLALVKKEIVPRIKDIGAFVELDNYASRILGLKDHTEKEAGWQQRQEFINRLKKIANQPYEALAESKGEFDPKLALSKMTADLDATLAGAWDLSQLIKFDNTALFFLEIPRFDGCAERQKNIAKFQKYVVEVYEKFLSYDSQKSILLEQWKKMLDNDKLLEIDLFLSLDRISLPVLQMKEDPHYPERQKKIDSLKKKMAEAYLISPLTQAIIDALKAEITDFNDLDQAVLTVGQRVQLEQDPDKKAALERLKKASEGVYDDKNKGIDFQKQYIAYCNLVADEKSLGTLTGFNTSIIDYIYRIPQRGAALAKVKEQFSPCFKEADLDQAYKNLLKLLNPLDLVDEVIFQIMGNEPLFQQIGVQGKDQLISLSCHLYTLYDSDAFKDHYQALVDYSNDPLLKELHRVLSELRGLVSDPHYPAENMEIQNLIVLGENVYRENTIENARDVYNQFVDAYREFYQYEDAASQVEAVLAPEEGQQPQAGERAALGFFENKPYPGAAGKPASNVEPSPVAGQSEPRVGQVTEYKSEPPKRRSSH